MAAGIDLSTDLRDRASGVDHQMQAIGVDPATAARRWQRLVNAGAAWITAYPLQVARRVSALVEIECVHDATLRVVQELARHNGTFSVNIKAGGHDILAEIASAEMSEFGRYRLEQLESVEGMRHVRTFPIIRVHTEASRWRLGVLNPATVTLLEESCPAPRSRHAPWGDREWETG